jgi:hypothetical protein
LSVTPTSRSIFHSQHRRAHLGAGLDPELLREPALVGREREVGGDQSGLAFADHAEQIQPGECIRFTQRVEAAFAQLHRHRIEFARRDQRLDRVHAGARHVRGAEQGVAHALALDLDDGLARERVARRGVDAAVFGLGHGAQSR